mgnify:CR=1 FL=1
MQIAYLVNQYPKVSHSFIRREIQTLEKRGWEVLRFAVRGCAEDLVDAADQEELPKTRYILKAGIIVLLSSLLFVLFTRSKRFIFALKNTIAIGWKSERGLLIHLIYLVEACVLLQWLKNTEVKLVHCHFGTNSTTVAMICYWLGGPKYSFTVHGPEEFDKVGAIALPKKIKYAAFVVAISNFGRSQLFRWCDPQQWTKIHVIRCGLSDDFLEQPFIPLPNCEETRLICVGRLTPQKGHFLLLEALHQLILKNYPCQLTLVGDGELRPALEKKIKDLNLQDYVTITGWATGTTVKKEILASHLMVLPSFAEGLPVVLTEALALSRPVLSTYIAGIPELVQDGKCGWLVSAGSVEALTQQLETVLQAPYPHQKLESIGKMGATYVKQLHSLQKEVKKLAVLFNFYYSNPK